MRPHHACLVVSMLTCLAAPIASFFGYTVTDRTLLILICTGVGTLCLVALIKDMEER